MKDIIVGRGNFRGKGIIANRNFKKGEVVVPYDLLEITAADFKKLPTSQHAYVHSFWGKRFLFRGASRYVNHADARPNTYQDLDKRGDIALRAITKGESVTTDGNAEIRNELDTFLEAYQKALRSDDPNAAKQFLSRSTIAKKEGRQIKFQKSKLHKVKWVKQEDTKATYTCEMITENSPKQNYRTHKALVLYSLERINGNWQIVGIYAG